MFKLATLLILALTGTATAGGEVAEILPLPGSGIEHYEPLSISGNGSLVVLRAHKDGSVPAVKTHVAVMAYGLQPVPIEDYLSDMGVDVSNYSILPNVAPYISDDGRFLTVRVLDPIYFVTLLIEIDQDTLYSQ